MGRCKQRDTNRINPRVIDKAIEGVSCAKSVFAEISSLYDYADELENNGQFEEGVRMRTKLNYISEFFVEKFEKDLES